MTNNSTLSLHVLNMIKEEIRTNVTFSDILFDYCLAGVDFSLAGNGGPSCKTYTPVERRTLEAILALVICCLTTFIGIKIHHRPTIYSGNSHAPKSTISHSPLRLCLMASLAISYGLELGYKLTTKQLIYILNPCHMLCLIQLYLLAYPANLYDRFTNYLFRIHLSQLYLPIVAFVCPVTNTLFQPGEVFTYYLEHVLLLLVPLYLAIAGGQSFKREPFWDVGYSLLAYSIFGLFNFGFLQPLAETTLANLNSILCPAISDPFAGPNWRLHALWHQLPQAIFGAKLYAATALILEGVVSLTRGRSKQD